MEMIECSPHLDSSYQFILTNFALGFPFSEFIRKRFPSQLLLPHRRLLLVHGPAFGVSKIITYIVQKSNFRTNSPIHARGGISLHDTRPLLDKDSCRAENISNGKIKHQTCAHRACRTPRMEILTVHSSDGCIRRVQRTISSLNAQQ